MFSENKELIGTRVATVISGLKNYSLKDTLECGQCFRYEKIEECDGWCEYLVTAKNTLIRIGQRRLGELLFFDISDEELHAIAIPHFNLYTDFEEIRTDVLAHTESEWLREAAECAKGIAILSQDPWETLFSFIISQNNNIPRIRKIIKALAAEYGENICLQKGIKKCPLSLINTTPCNEKCKECGICYTFPTAAAVAENPEKMLSARVGFRYKYLLCAAERVAGGETNLDMIAAARSYEHTKRELMKIYGVGEKVAACVALFGFGNLDAFPIDVWMKRAIDEYFDGSLDHEALGRYRGVAQQYIFHYIRNLQGKE